MNANLSDIKLLHPSTTNALNPDAIDPFSFTERFLSAFKMRSPMFTATTLLALVSLVLSRPPDRLRPRDVADGLSFNLAANPSGLTIPSSSEFLPSLPDESSYPSIGSPNLGFSAPGSLGAFPQSPATDDASDSTGFAIDDTNTVNPPGDGASDMALLVEPTLEKFLAIQTAAVQKCIDSISDGELTYAIFQLARNRRSLVPTVLSTDNDWNAFAQKIRTADPSYVLHSLPDAILLIFTYQTDLGLLHKRTELLYENRERFFQIVRARSQKQVYGRIVYDDVSLRQAIDSHSQADPIDLALPPPGTPGFNLDINGFIRGVTKPGRKNPQL